MVSSFKYWRNWIVFFFSFDQKQCSYFKCILLPSDFRIPSKSFPCISLLPIQHISVYSFGSFLMVFIVIQWDFIVMYPLVNQHKYGTSPFSAGKLTISMAIFNSQLLVIARGYAMWGPQVISWFITPSNYG